MARSNRVVRASFIRVILEQRLEGAEDVDICGEMFEVERRASAKALRWKHALWV